MEASRLTLPYTSSLICPKRRKTREVKVGDVSIGGSHPIVIQSMTTTSTLDTKGTVDQIQRMVEVGCQIVRVTTPTMADVENLPNIRGEMKLRRIQVPLVADVHFLPQIALKACDYVEKVRINPGNFADRKRFITREYTDEEYQTELSRIRSVFVPIVAQAKKNHVALRIGTNHGSLSDRIMNRFGDTPLGMVESALEFVKIAEDENFKEIVISMKSSNPLIMIEAYRLLAAKMDELKMDYPLHLGVTEAGDGEDGRVKSSMGIGSLLADGLGDTIRVSLTEDPEAEVPVANLIAKYYTKTPDANSNQQIAPSWDLYSYQRRESIKVSNRYFEIGKKETVRVRTHLPLSSLENALELIRTLEPEAESISIDLSIPTFPVRFLEELHGKHSIFLRLAPTTSTTLSDLHSVPFDELSLPINLTWSEKGYAFKLDTFLKNRPLWLRINKAAQLPRIIQLIQTFSPKIQIGVEVEGANLIALARELASILAQTNLTPPFHLHFVADRHGTEADLLVRAPTELGSLLCDGIGDSIEISSSLKIGFNHRMAFNILQAARLRMSKTEFISCPSCGRTLFDLQETTGRIRVKTGHLKGVKIAIMGCIVNGPGEMADADFGYVGSGPGHINLYVGKECVERHIPTQEADERLIALIKKQGRWVNPT